MCVRFECFFLKGLEAFREQVLKLAKDRKDFPTSRLPPAWFEIDRFVKQRRSRGHSIMHVDEIVEEFTTNSPEDMRNTVVSTVGFGCYVLYLNIVSPSVLVAIKVGG